MPSRTSEASRVLRFSDYSLRILRSCGAKFIFLLAMVWIIRCHFTEDFSAEIVFILHDFDRAERVIAKMRGWSTCKNKLHAHMQRARLFFFGVGTAIFNIRDSHQSREGGKMVFRSSCCRLPLCFALYYSTLCRNCENLLSRLRLRLRNWKTLKKGREEVLCRLA